MLAAVSEGGAFQSIASTSRNAESGPTPCSPATRQHIARALLRCRLLRYAKDQTRLPRLVVHAGPRRAAIAEYLDVFYNRHQPPSVVGFRSPAEYEKTTNTLAPHAA